MTHTVMPGLCVWLSDLPALKRHIHMTTKIPTPTQITVRIVLNSTEGALWRATGREAIELRAEMQELAMRLCRDSGNPVEVREDGAVGWLHKVWYDVHQALERDPNVNFSTGRDLRPTADAE